MQAGRLDAKTSSARKVNLPSPSLTASQTLSAFAQKGLTATDMVLLLARYSRMFVFFFFWGMKPKPMTGN